MPGGHSWPKLTLRLQEIQPLVSRATALVAIATPSAFVVAFPAMPRTHVERRHHGGFLHAGFQTALSAQRLVTPSSRHAHLPFFLVGAAWVRSRAERPSVSEVSGQLRVQFGCKLSSKLSKKRIKQGKQQIKVTKFQI